MTFTADNYVILNVWLPRINGEIGTTSQFLKNYARNTLNGSSNFIGHVSLETPKLYASWWPSENNTEQVGLFNVVCSDNATYEMDCENEGGREPDFRVALYSLDIDEIEACFRNIENSDYGYVLTGDKKITRLLNDEKGQSCCGLAYELLMAGNVLALSGAFNDIAVKWIVVTPSNFIDFAKNIKETELKKYPETQAFPSINHGYQPFASAPLERKCFIL